MEARHAWFWFLQWYSREVAWVKADFADRSRGALLAAGFSGIWWLAISLYLFRRFLPLGFQFSAQHNAQTKTLSRWGIGFEARQSLLATDKAAFRHVASSRLLWISFRQSSLLTIPSFIWYYIGRLLILPQASVALFIEISLFGCWRIS